jgi:hypothetical protein
MRISNIEVVKPQYFNEAPYKIGIREFSDVFRDITASRIQACYEATGRESDKSISRFVNSLILDDLVALGWEKNWSFCPDVKSNHATFEASKKIDSGRKQLRFAMDVASRHSNEALGYLLKGQIATMSANPRKHGVDCHLLISFTQELLTIGKWDTGVISHEKLLNALPLLSGSISTPIYIFGIGSPEGLEVSKSMAGTLKVLAKG